MLRAMIAAGFGIELVVRIAVGMDVAEAVVDAALRNVEQRNAGTRPAP